MSEDNLPEPPLPDDFEPCGECGFDHEYEYTHAVQAHNEMIGDQLLDAMFGLCAVPKLCTPDKCIHQGETCPTCQGEGLVNFTDEEWISMHGVPMSEYTFTGDEEETMKRCPDCKGSGSTS